MNTYTRVKAKPRTSAWSSIANFLSKGWETIIGPSNARCKAYCNQAEVAQEKMQNDKLSRKERKFWSKQKKIYLISQSIYLTGTWSGIWIFTSSIPSSLDI